MTVGEDLGDIEPSLLKRMMATLPQRGVVQWIGVSPGRREPIVEVQQVMVRVGTGIDGDCHALRGTGKRQVTLIQAEHIEAIASMAHLDTLLPTMLRRNLVVRGVNLLAFRGRNFRVGDAIFAYSGSCDPCNRMEENLGLGGFNAMRGHGGITATVVSAGLVRLGDAVGLAE